MKLPRLASIAEASSTAKVIARKMPWMRNELSSYFYFPLMKDIHVLAGKSFTRCAIRTEAFVDIFAWKNMNLFRKIISQLCPCDIWKFLFIILHVIDKMVEKTGRSERKYIGNEGKLLDVVTVIMTGVCPALFGLSKLVWLIFGFDEMLDSTSGENQYVGKTKINPIQKCVRWMNNARKLPQIFYK